MSFYFTGVGSHYHDKKIEMLYRNFNGHYPRGFYLLPKLRITPGLFQLLFKDQDIFIKTLDDRFAIPLIFLFAKILRKPIILWSGFWMHPQTSFHKLSYGLTKFIYRHSDAIIVYGEHVKRYLRDLGIKERKIFCAPHAVDNALFNKSISLEDQRELKQKLELAENKIVLYVGRLEECKGLKYLVEAISKIKNLSIALLFIGGGALKQSLEEQCRVAGIKCHFLDYINNQELYRYYAIADVFVLPSITTKYFKEPWGLVVNEAMNQGCPIVVTDAVGAAQGGLVENGKNGFIVPERNSEALRERIEYLFGHEDVRSQMSQRSKEKIKDWTHERMVRGFYEVIHFVSEKGKV